MSRNNCKEALLIRTRHWVGNAAWILWFLIASESCTHAKISISCVSLSLWVWEFILCDFVGLVGVVKHETYTFTYFIHFLFNLFSNLRRLVRLYKVINCFFWNYSLSKALFSILETIRINKMSQFSLNILASFS